MFPFLKSHAFAVEAFFESSIVLSFAVPTGNLQRFIPECLKLDTFKEEWGFIAVAMVQTKNLRPKGFPEYLGNDFFLFGYRIFVQYINSKGKRLRGLYILKSETDKARMSFFGNMFTHYKYTTTDVSLTKRNRMIEIQSMKSDLKVILEIPDGEIPLPLNSPFDDWKEARRFEGPLPFTFTYDPESKEILIIEGVRQNWTPKPVRVIDYNISFLKSLNIEGAILANAFIINDIPYYWKKGKTEQWKA